MWAVINVGVGDHMDQLTGTHITDLSQHMDQDRVLDHIPVIGGQHVLGPLIEDRVQRQLIISLFLGDVEGHTVGAGIKAHFMQILMDINIGHDTPAEGIVLQVIDDPVHLIHHPFLILMLYAQLVTVGFADGAVLVGPLIPDMAVQIMDVIGLLLPDPENFIGTALQGGPAQGQQGEFLLQIITVADAEFLNGIGRRSVGPVGTDLFSLCTGTVLKNISAHGNKYLIRFAQKGKVRTSVSFRPHEKTVKIDRKNSGSRRAIVHQRRCLVEHRDGVLTIRLILDRFSAECFVGEGEQVMSIALYTDTAADGISFYADGDAVMDLKFALLGDL